MEGIHNLESSDVITPEFAEDLRQHQARIHRAALVMTGDPWDAEDLAQETFLLATQNYHKFRGQSSAYTWLYGILLNVERRHRRRRGTWRRNFPLLCDDRARSARVTPGANEAAEVAEWRESLWSKVAQLPDNQRLTLVLRFSEGLQYDEIAEVLGCPLGTVKSRIHHGLTRLRTLLEAAGDEYRRLPTAACEDLNYAV